jgi:Na+/melibiose symporter-like transporter
MSEDISRAQLYRYGMLAVPVAFAGFPLYVLAPDYYATHHGVSLSLLGFLLLGLRVFDAVQDPLIGMLSDRFRHHAKTYMGLAALCLCLAMYGLFNLVFSPAALWFAICVAVAVSAYSVLSINLYAVGGTWSAVGSVQTRIATTREAAGLLGLVVAVSLPTVLMQYFDPSVSYRYFAITLCVLMGVAWWAFRPCLKQFMQLSVPAAEKMQKIRFMSLPPMTRSLLLIYGVSMLASAIPAVLVLFFVRDRLEAEQLTGAFLLIYFLAGALAMPAWRRISAKIGRYRTWLLAMLLAVISFICAFLLQAGDIFQYAAVCLFSGLAFGAELALPPAILASHLYIADARQRASSYYALLTLVAKLSLAFASAAVLPLLDMAGYVPAAENHADALMALTISYALIPCALKLMAALWLWRAFILHKQGDDNEVTQTHRDSWSANHA